MTTTWAISLLRSIIISGLCLYPAFLLSSTVKTFYKKNLYLVLILLPLAIPPLLPAYSFSAFSFNFQTSPALNEILYGLTTLFKALPITFLILYLLPCPFSSSALYCNSLTQNKPISFIQRFGLMLPAWCITFLFIFHEYEIASLMRIKHWTIDMFNAHAGGLIQSPLTSLKLALLPFMTSIGAVATALLTLPKFYNAKATKSSQAYLGATNTLILVSIGLLLLFPAVQVFIGGLDGFKMLLEGQWMKNELLNSLLFTLTATCCCWFLSLWLWDNVKNRFILTVLILPGLLGGLLLGLSFTYIFNLPGLSSLKQTVIPLTFALIAYGLPFAILLQIFNKREQDNASLHAAKIMPPNQQRNVMWHLSTMPKMLFAIPLFCIIWFDLTLSSMLAPTAMPGIFPRLYNLMHYNESARLSATVIIALTVPFLITGISLLIIRFLNRRP